MGSDTFGVTANLIDSVDRKTETKRKQLFFNAPRPNCRATPVIQKNAFMHFTKLLNCNPDVNEGACEGMVGNVVAGPVVGAEGTALKLQSRDRRARLAEERFHRDVLGNTESQRPVATG